MRTPLLLLLAACVLFVGFLFSDGFGDAKRGDGTRTFLPGYAVVLLQLDLLPSEVFKLSEWGLVQAPVLLAEVAFLVLPVLFFKGVLKQPRCNQAMRLVFLCGGCAYAWLLWLARFSPPEFGAYLWLMAAMTAVECLASCLSPPVTSSPSGLSRIQDEVIQDGNQGRE